MSAVPQGLERVPEQPARERALSPGGTAAARGDDAGQAYAEKQEELHRARWRHAHGVAPNAATAGLALSGGGIRSATLGLGVLEGLRDLKLLPRFDYLSSVSGGGYIMGWLTAHCRRGTGWLGADSATVRAWDSSIAHLSKYSNYLSPRVGAFSADTWSVLTVWGRNALLVQMTVICGIVLALLAPRAAMLWFVSWPKHDNLRWLTVLVFIVAIAGIAANQLHQRYEAARRRKQAKNKESKRMLLSWVGAPVGALAGVACLLAAQYFADIHDFKPFPERFPEPVTVDNLARAGVPAVPIALLCVAAAMAFVTCAVSVRFIFGGKECVNAWPDYGQGWVQLLVVLPLLLTSVAFAAVLWRGASLLEKPQAFGQLFTHGLGYWPLPLACAFAALVALTCCSFRRWTGFKGRTRVPRVVFNAVLIAVTSVVCIAALHAAFAGIVVLMQTFVGDGGVRNAFVWGPSLVLVSFAFAVVLLIGIMGRASMEGMREWWSRLAAWLWIYALVWNMLTMSAIHGPALVTTVVNPDSWEKAMPLLAWIGTTAAGLLASSSGATRSDTKIRSRESTLVSTALEVVAKVAPVIFILGLLLIVAAVIERMLPGFYLEPTSPLGKLADCTPGQWWSVFADYLRDDGAILAGIAGGVTVLLGLLAWRVDINEFSLQSFYRSRLVRCYLGASRQARTPQKFTQFDDADDLRVSELGGEGFTGPLHLINCTVNLGGTRDLSLHTRHGASFTVTPYTIGSASPIEGDQGRHIVGFREHGHYRGRGMTLGEALATSGAAASPNQGFHTSSAAAFMMTMFNARLGRWCPNPRHATAYTSPWFSLAFLVRELFGTASERSSYLMVSDGGHFDNLGVYELVRRRCKLIVSVDAECDAAMHFGALGTLIRLCQVDFKTRIEIDVDRLRPSPDSGRSQSHLAVGRILYPPLDDGRGAEEGVLVYIKAALTPALRDASVLQYHATHPAFPHESTGDQFYGEDQFESYRRLGRHLVKHGLGAGLDADSLARIVQLRPDFASALAAAPVSVTAQAW
ncbi:hypothetical protein [Pseudoduganella buxea]|uniref:PNPLA domain-containing protein n=1 Tax=Pseudoduganella buxea TaxID=1949069 RepID=A0A6I3SSY4_9BURK|nr:hypothetical protein [Pseudoduganella buxea]MTV52268.1 hypothetical protein [Pseudoduganella buxea]GGB86805.1 hypothetical protein GCM10011572_05990 [Pseudoduganella buxea]